MNLELNREYPDPDEAKLIEEMVKVAVERMKPQQGRIRRGQHAKATGCVRGVFRIRDDVPVDLRHGVFYRPGQSFQAAGWFALFHPRHLTSIMKILSETVASPLVTYWSGSPYWLGPPGTTGGCAVKYSLVPGFKGAAPPIDLKIKPDDYLSQALEQYLRTREAVFEFRVQPQTDPVAMPVEDVSVEWDEAVSKPIPVATLTIGVQDVDSTEGRALAEECETMAFSPWNALAEHRPMGGINRLRQAVYLASQAKRASKSLL